MSVFFFHYNHLLGVQESKIEADPFDRTHQQHISQLKREVKIIRETIRKQEVVLEGAQEFLRETQTRNENYAVPRYSRRDAVPTIVNIGTLPGENSYSVPRYSRRDAVQPTVVNIGPPPGETISAYPISQISATDPEGIQGLLLQDCLNTVEKRGRDFLEIEDQASDLQGSVRFLSIFCHESLFPMYIAHLSPHKTFLHIAILLGLLAISFQDLFYLLCTLD